ncbi:MAG: hypothetical protein AAGK97_02925, partial [Bacteroidota bacterium]
EYLREEIAKLNFEARLNDVSELYNFILTELNLERISYDHFLHKSEIVATELRFILDALKNEIAV